MDSPLLIAQLDPPHTGREGDWYYRTFAPGNALAEERGIYIINLDNVHRRKAEVLRHADVLVLNSVVDPDLLPVLAERRAAHLLSVYEISDDISAVPTWNPACSFYRNRENLRLFLRLARSCDAIQYSTEALKRRFGHLHRRGQVFQNQITTLPPPRARAEGGAKLVIGWGGSRGHHDDLAAIAEPLMGWLGHRPEVQLHLMGAEALWRLFDPLPPSRKVRTPPGSIDDYYAFLRGLDIGLAPLCDNGFNRGRSDVKFLEYAAHGVVAVVQALDPYLDTVRPGETGFLFEEPAGLLPTLDALVAAHELRDRVSTAAYDYVRCERQQAAHVTERLSYYQELLAALPHQPRSTSACASFFASLSRWEGVEVRGRHAVLQPTRYERLLHDGLLLSQREGRAAEAMALFQEAARLEPQNHQPYLCMATAGAGADALAEALRRNPRSLQSWLALGTVHLHQGAPGRAIERFLTAAELAPGYEVPFLRTAQVLRQLGDPEEATRMEQAAEELLRDLGPDATLRE